MKNTYGKDAARLMNDVVRPENVGGFMQQFLNFEVIYAVNHDGRVLCRNAPRPNDDFHGNNWQVAHSVPQAAEWIGQ